MAVYSTPTACAPPDQSESAQRGLLSTCALVECLAGLALVLAPGPTTAQLLGKPQGSVVTRLAGVALLALGIVCWDGRTDPGRAVRSGAFRLILAYNTGAGFVLALLGATGNARGPGVWAASVLHLSLAGALARAFGLVPQVAALRIRRPGRRTASPPVPPAPVSGWA